MNKKNKLNPVTPKKETGTDPESDDILPEKNEDSDISLEEKDLLDRAGENEEDIELHKAGLDNTDDEGEPLNEKSNADDLSGKDLDVPGAADDDADEDIGEEDEENNEYSLGADKD